MDGENAKRGFVRGFVRNGDGLMVGRTVANRIMVTCFWVS